MTSTSLADFLDRYAAAIAQAVAQTYPPLYVPTGAVDADLGRLRRRPLGAQADAIRAAALSLRTNRATFLVGEMGTGKTFISIAAAQLAGCRRVLVMCPPHLVRKWEREVQLAIPDAATAIVRTIGDLERTRMRRGTVFVILSREQAKLGPRWQPCVWQRVAVDEGRAEWLPDGTPLTQPACPGCGGFLVDGEGVPLTLAELTKTRHRCPACHAPLWSVDRSGPRRTPLADYLRRRMRGDWDLLICDEVHEYKARGSAQGMAAAALAGACRRTLTLTGTLAGGYSSTLFYLLYRFSPGLRREFGYGDVDRWIARYGITQRITKREDAVLEDGRTSRRKQYQTRTVEKPGITPGILFHLIGNSVFLRLRDLAQDLPPYIERVLALPLDTEPLLEEPDGRGGGRPISQASAYQRLAQDLLTAVRDALRGGSRRLLGTYLQALLGWPDHCVRPEVVVDPDPEGDGVLAAAPALPEERLYPKERALLDLCRRERARGRRVLVYLTHTETRDLTPRLLEVLRREQLRAAVLKANTVPPERREEWLAARVRDGAQVLLVHPRLVQTGLDLVDWPTAVWYQMDFSVYVMRQASRRAWRLGAKAPVEVVYLAYDRTLQTEALALIAAKLRTSLMVEGELPEEGLAALDDGAEDMFLELARSLTDRGAAAEASLDALFAAARRAETEANVALTTDLQTAVADALVAQDGAVPSVLVPDGQRDPVDGRASSSAAPAEPEEPGAQQVSLLELYDRLIRPRRRGRRHQPAPGQLSLFE